MGIENKSTTAELIETYKQYIKLLGSEIDELVGWAYFKGWRSKNVEEGQRLRDKIKQLEEDGTEE